jgi:hypothetical protein
MGSEKVDFGRRLCNNYFYGGILYFYRYVMGINGEAGPFYFKFGLSPGGNRQEAHNN